MRVWFRTLWLIAFAAAAIAPTAAQDKQPGGKAQQQPQGKPQAAPQAPPAVVPPVLPDAFKLNLLIRSSIVALNQANQTGNYTVLQDLGAPAFRAANNSAKLAQIFGALRQRQLDLSPVLFFTPKLLAEPQIAPNGLLRLTGFFPTQPERVNFDLIYERTDAQWRLFGIGVSTSPAEVTSAIPQAGGAERAPGSPAPPQNAQGQPAAPPANEARPEPSAPAQAAQKPNAAPGPGRKPKAAQQSGPGKPGGAPAGQTGVAAQNGAVDNAGRIDVAAPGATASPGPAQSDAGAEPAPATPTKPESPWENITPFSQN